MLTGSTTIVIRCAHDRFPMPTAPVGAVKETQYRLKRDENDNAVYVAVGELDVCEFINSFKNGCSLASLLERTQFMPVREKVGYLQQTEDGFSADMSAMPKDGTEAFIAVSELCGKYPKLVERVKNGESFDTVIKDIFGKSAVLDKLDPALQNVKNDESEVK